MNKVYVLVAQAYNDIVIPCLIFGTEEEALQARDRAEVLMREYYKSSEEFREEPEEDESFLNEKFKEFFTHVDFGCGEPGGFIVEEVEFGKAFVPFNLD